MNIYESIEVGQEVVYGQNGRLGFATVTKVTKTQITISGNGTTRFNRRNGVALGYGDSWYQGPRIQTVDVYSDNEHLMTRAEAEAIITRQKNEDEQRRLSRLIRDSKWTKASINNLKAAIELLGISEENNND